MKRYFLFLMIFSSGSYLSAVVPSISGLAAKGFNVELKSPVYTNGALSTDQGGIIQGKNFFLQAKNITYIRRVEDDVEVQRIEAEGNLFFRYQDHAYIGRRIEFDLNSQTGVIYDVVTETGPWFVGGSRIILKPDGSSIIHDCTVSTSENEQNDWAIRASEVYLSKSSTLRAKNVSFSVKRLPIFWWPSFTKDLKDHTSSPIKYRFRYFGKHGPRVGLSYTFNVAENWKSRLLFDVSVTRGAGGGFELEYKNPEKKAERFSGFNYYAYDMKTTDTTRLHRYRFQGKYANSYFNDTVAFRSSYDKLSDDDFTSDFTSRGLDSGRAGPTEAQWTKKEENWIGSVNAKARLNSFQTVKQTLPLFQYTMRPMNLGNSGWVLDNRLSAGYLDYRYASHTPHVEDFHSSRIDINQKTYRNFIGDSVVFTPYMGYRMIGYGNSPQSDAKLLALGTTGFECHTRFWRGQGSFHQALEPYVQYDYVTTPSVKPPKHYIFDLQDGLYRQNVLRFGTRNFLRLPYSEEYLAQLNFDLYARAFFDTPTIKNRIPRIYLDSTYKATPYTLYTLGSAWDTRRNNIDHVNVRSDVTLTDNVAFSLEYRHRNSFAWRKVDPDNFMLDAFRDEKTLRHSTLSDRRDTFLARLFVRLAPSVAVELISRNGWNRKFAPSYTEYECNVFTLFRGAFQVTFNFQHREYENRYAVYFSLGAKPPSNSTSFNKIGRGNYTIP